MKDLRIIIQVFLLFAGTFMAEIRTLADNTQMEKDITFSQISIQDGLSQSTVLSITQDSKGHMWFATHDGLNRYDGYEFTIYRHNPEDSTTIADNIIRNVYIDEFDKLWIGTESGLSYYDRTLDQFRNFNTDGKSVTSICGIPDGKILVAAGGALNIFDSHTEQWKKSSPPCQNESFGATILYKEEGNIWIGTKSEGLFCYHLGSNDIKRVSSFKSDRAIQCILKHDGKIFIATEGDGLHCIDGANEQNIVYHHNESDPRSISSNYVRTLSTDSFGRLWVGTFQGLSILENQSFHNIKSDPLSEGSLSQNSVRCISQDNQGGLWLGTWFGGVNYWHPLRNRFTSIKMTHGNNSLNDNVVNCITEDSDGSLWIGTNSGGVNHLDSGTGRFTYYKLKPDDAENVESNDIKAIYIDEDTGLIYVGAHAGGLNVIDKSTKKIHHCQYERSDAQDLDVYAILNLEQQKLLLGTLSGLKTYDKSNGRFNSIYEDVNGYPIRKLRIKTLLKDSQGRLWIGGENGLGVYDIKDGMLHKNSLLPSDSPLYSAYTEGFLESSTKMIWIATRNGLWCYDTKGQKFSKYTRKDGLSSDIIHGIEEDSYGRLWISTDNGLCCFNPFSGSFRNFSISDGLSSNQFNPGSHCSRKNGEIMFGSINGINTFDPAVIEANPFNPSPSITNIQVFNIDVRPMDESGILEKNILDTERIILRHDQNSITFEFSVPNYLSGGHNTFAYMLAGYDKEWYEVKDKRSVSYSNLPHGEYTFKVKAANNDGKWNDTPTTIRIRIKPIWYKTAVALTCFGLLLLGFFVALYMFIIERKEREGKLELEKQEKVHQEDIHQMKMRFFINISHEMRTPLTLIINPLQEMISKSTDTWMRKQLKYCERNAKRLLHLVNQLMDYRRAELGVFKLSVRQENVHKIVKENWAFYEKLAQSKKIRYSLISDVEGKSIYTDGQYLELILNNLLSNAFKYTDEGSITVKVYERDKKLVIEVCDTGTGIPSDQKNRIFERFYQVDNEHIGSGIGLSLVQRLVDLHHGTIGLESEVNKGSTFIIELPATVTAYSEEELEDRNNQWAYTTNTPDISMLEAEQHIEEFRQSEEKKRGRLLIAEDDEEIRAYMSDELSKLFDITLAKNGEEAIQLLKENEPDIVLTDMMMPVMDGMKLCAHIKQNINTGHIPVIMLSAKTDSKDELEAFKIGADAYVQKPFSMTMLIARIQNMLKTRHRLHDKVTKSMDISPEKISFNVMDEMIINKAINIVKQNIDNAEFSTEEFAKAMNMSRSNLHLKLKALTGESALDFIRKIRFKEACRLLKDGRYSISEISDMVGFNTPSYFATCFKKYIGCLPTEYIKKNN